MHWLIFPGSLSLAYIFFLLLRRWKLKVQHLLHAITINQAQSSTATRGANKRPHLHARLYCLVRLGMYSWCIDTLIWLPSPSVNCYMQECSYKPHPTQAIKISAFADVNAERKQRSELMFKYSNNGGKRLLFLNCTEKAGDFGPSVRDWQQSTIWLAAALIDL